MFTGTLNRLITVEGCSIYKGDAMEIFSFLLGLLLVSSAYAETDLKSPAYDLGAIVVTPFRYEENLDKAKPKNG